MPEYQTPRTLAETQAALAAAAGDLLVMAGGTDLMVRARDRVRTGSVLDVSRVAELRRIVIEDGELVLGAAVTYAECLRDPLIRRVCPLLTRVAERFASPQIREMATLGGNIANASPAGDGVAALWALDAAVEAVTPEGPVRLPIVEVVLGPGRLGLPPASLLTQVRVTVARSAEGSAFSKLVNRAWPEHPMAISVASVAARLRLGPDGRVTLARVALGAVAPTPIRADAAEAALVGREPTAGVISEAARAVPGAARPISDIRAGAAYRRDVLASLARRAIAAAAEAARTGSEARGASGGLADG